jgi:hypothetical protein
MDPKRPLSEISHLFLSEIRSRQPEMTRPTRIGPKKQQVDASIDMTPEEFAASLEAVPTRDEQENLLQVTDEKLSGEKLVGEKIGAEKEKQVSLSVVLSAHLPGNASQSVRQYARHVAGEFGRVGLAEIDSGEFSIGCYELDGGPAASPIMRETLDVRQMSETLNELAMDVDRWLISLPNAKTAESRELLRSAPHWVILTTADHEGVVATYRALKGLAELGRRRISLVVLDARDDAHADAVFRKLDAVSRQFLHSGLEAGLPLRHVQNVTEHQVLACQRDAEQASSNCSGHWRVIGQFVSKSVAPPVAAAPPFAPMAVHAAKEISGNIETKIAEKIAEPVSQSSEDVHEFKTQKNAGQTMKLNIAEGSRMASMDATISGGSISEVIDLPEDAGERSILDAVVRQGGAEGRWVMCPIKVPMCPEALVAVGRDQRLMMLAVAGRGLGQLLSIGQALRWMGENIELIKMALPQLAVDASVEPCVKLLVDQRDLSAEILQPMLQSETITVQAYRRVKWGMKMGLLLEAA